ncbi:MAG: hypothetical protein EP330_08105 [Deltaproteobacteria bacterium]|nr:MAG: hypothetical protein EP330_08105 [Deltaproteobacteria bacterium]
MRTSSLLLLLLLAACAPELPADSGTTPTFAEDIEPILQTHCLRCHVDPSPSNAGLGYVRQPNRDGDLTIDPDIARATAIRSACTALSPTVIEAYADVLYSTSFDATCGGDHPITGKPEWKALSMPPGTSLKLTVEEQVAYAKWIEGGMP